jgi:hypothetical protein
MVPTVNYLQKKIFWNLQFAINFWTLQNFLEKEKLQDFGAKALIPIVNIMLLYPRLSYHNKIIKYVEIIPSKKL